MYVFKDLDEVREICRKWIKEYNEEHPHQSLGKLTPLEYRMKYCLENFNFVGTKRGGFTKRLPKDSRQTDLFHQIQIIEDSLC